MIEHFLDQTKFSSQQDFIENFHIKVPENFNFAFDVMDRWAAEQPDKLALLWTNDKGVCLRFTFGDLKRLTDKTAAYLVSLGIGKGDMVMLTLKRNYEFWLVILALHKIGAVTIPATHMLTSSDIVYRCNRADIKAVICAGEQYIVDQVHGALAESPSLKILVSIGPIVPEDFHDFHKEWENCGEFKGVKSNTNDDMMLIYFTSGTSGEPKMVAHDFTYALGHLVTGVYWHNLGPDSLHLTIADTGWGKAVWGKLYGQWFAGATVFVYDFEKFTPSDLLTQMQNYHVTSLCAPPTIFRFLLQEDFSKYDLSSLRYCCTAGEALNGAVFDKFYELTGLKLHEGFGQTETTMTLGTFPWMESKPGSMGVPNPQYDIDLMKADGSRPAVGERGEIVVKVGKTKPLGLFKEYYKDPELTAKVWHDGYYHTGDVAWMDEDGYYWFVGRNDDVIKSSGYRISPFEVESVLMKHPAVVECAVTGVPDQIRGMIVKATVVLSMPYRFRRRDLLVKELQDFVKENTAPYKYPRVIQFVKALPKTISGKIRRVEIRENDKKSIHKAITEILLDPFSPVEWSANDVSWMENLL